MRKRKKDYKNTYQLAEIRPATWTDAKRKKNEIVEYYQVTILLPYPSTMRMQEVAERSNKDLELFFGYVLPLELLEVNELAYDLNVTSCFGAKYINDVAKNSWKAILYIKNELDLQEWKAYQREYLM